MHLALSGVIFCLDFWSFLFSSLVPLPGVFPLFICFPLCLCIKESPIMPCDLNIENHGIGQLKTTGARKHVLSAAIDNLHLWFKIRFLFKLQTPAASICISHDFDSLRVNF